MKGLVSKGIGGFYTVITGSGSYRARARGRFKNEDLTLTVGDIVELVFTDNPEEDALISEIYPRKNIFTRPPVANLDAMVLIISVIDPTPNLFVCDKMLAASEQRKVRPIICINKADLGDREDIEKIKKIYENIYPTLELSAYTGKGIDELLREIKGEKAAFAGPSGVGKSTLINKIIPEAHMETGRVSCKTARGRHTTRHVELFRTGDGYIFDTPGFTSFSLENMEPREVSLNFPEIREESVKCRFYDCMHKNEPGCAVIEALHGGKISESRYKSYLACLNDAERNQRY